MARYKINNNKKVTLLYSDDKQAKNERREMSPFTIARNYIKYFVVTLIKQVKNLYDKNFTSLKNEIEEDIRKWKDLP